jgi:hypothetical protein
MPIVIGLQDVVIHQQVVKVEVVLMEQVEELVRVAQQLDHS